MRQIREAGGMTQQRVADLLSMRAATVSQIEVGDMSPTLTSIAALARVLHVPLASLFTFEGEPASADPASAEERELLDAWRKLPEARRRLLLELVRDLGG